MSQIKRPPSYLTLQMVRFFYKEMENVKPKIWKDIKFPIQQDVFDLYADELKLKLALMRKIFNDSEDKETLEAKNKRKTTKNEEEKKEKKTEPYSFPDDLASNSSAQLMANQSSPLPPNSPLVTRTPPVPTGQQRNTNTAQDGSLSPVMVRSKSPISAPNSPIEQRAMFGNHSVPIINGHTHFRQSQRGPQQFTHPVGGPIYGPTLVQPSVPAYALHSPLVGVDPAAAVGAYNVPQQRASQDFPPSQISDDIELAEMKRLVSQRDHDEAITPLELQVQLQKKITAAALRLLEESVTSRGVRRRGVRLRRKIYLQAVTKLNSLEGQLRDLKIGRCVIIREDGGRKKKARPMSDDEEGFLRQAQLMANQSSPLPPNSPLVTRTPPVPTGQQRNTNTAQDGSLSPVMVRSKSPISAPNSPIEQRAMFGNHSVPIINGHTHFRQSQRGPQQFTHPVGGPIYGPTLVQPSVPAYALHSPLVGVDPAAAVGAYNVPQQRASQDFPPSQISDDIELAEMKRLVSQRDHDEAIASLELQVQLKKKITAAALRLLKESSTRRGVRLRERIYLQAVTKLNSLEGQLRDLKIGRCVIIREDGGRKKKARPMSDDEEGFLRQAQLMANQSSPLPPNSPLVTRTPPVPTGQQRNTNTAQDGSLSPVMVRSKSPISAPNSPIEQRAMFGNHSVPIINGHTHFRQSQRGPQQFTHPVGGPIYGPTLVQPSVPAYALHSPLVGVDPAAAVGAYNVPQQRASQDFPPSQISDDIELAEMKRLVS
ncbi:uncharacterized protein LOC136043715, partial [Artemia franciscana]